MASQLHENIWGEIGAAIAKRPITCVACAFAAGFTLAVVSARSSETTAECILRNTSSSSSNLHIGTVKAACIAEHGKMQSADDVAESFGL